MMLSPMMKIKRRSHQLHFTFPALPPQAKSQKKGLKQ